MKSEFDAQVLTETTVSTGRLTMTFQDSAGDEMVLSLPLSVAADTLVPVLSKLKKELGAKDPGAPQYARNVKKWAVGRSNEYPHLWLIFDDDPPIALTVVSAKKLWREVREEAEIIERRRPATRQ